MSEIDDLDNMFPIVRGTRRGRPKARLAPEQVMARAKKKRDRQDARLTKLNEWKKANPERMKTIRKIDNAKQRHKQIAKRYIEAWESEATRTA